MSRAPGVPSRGALPSDDAAGAPTGQISALPCLDGVRWFAAMLVFASHLSSAVYRASPGTVDVQLAARIDGLSRLGVFIFFMLSGFLLYRPFVLAQFTGAPSPRPVEFWIRRGARILPGYWVALAGAIALGVAVYTQPSAFDYATSFALLQNYRAYGFLSSGLFVAWTLVVEVAFYAVLPGIAAIADRAGRLRGRGAILRANVVVLAAMLVIGVTTRFVAIFGVDSRLPSRMWFPVSNLGQWLPAYLDIFAIGMALAVVVAWRETGGGVPRLVAAFARRPWASWLIFLIMISALGRTGLPKVPGSLGIGPTALFLSIEVSILGALAFLLPGAIPGRRVGGIRRLLAWKPVVLFGTVAFGVYLWQMPCISLVERWSDSVSAFSSPWALTLAAVVVTMVAAYASYVGVEVPARRIAMRLTGRPPGPRSGRWSWLRIDASEHSAGISGFVWAEDTVHDGERSIVATAILGATGFVLVLPAIRAALG